jgi:hypothetical protein
MSHWVPNSIRIIDFITPSATMQLIVTISDELATVNVTEGGIDNFSITDFSLVTISEESESTILIYPNPAHGSIYFSGVTEGQVTITDFSGRLVLESTVQNEIDISIGCLVFILFRFGIRQDRLFTRKN